MWPDLPVWKVALSGTYDGEMQIAERLLAPTYYQPQVGHRIFIVAWHIERPGVYFTTPVVVVEVVAHTRWESDFLAQSRERVELSEPPTLIVEPAP